MADSLAIRDDHSRSGGEPHKQANAALGVLVLGALGVVYGDIGTSPLYTLRAAYEWAGSAAPDVALGLLSLIVWTLLITTSIKYVALVMRADNNGEGGILALMARVGMKRSDGTGRIRPGIVWLGILGAALLYGCEFVAAQRSAGMEDESPLPIAGSDFLGNAGDRVIAHT